MIDSLRYRTVSVSLVVVTFKRLNALTFKRLEGKNFIDHNKFKIKTGIVKNGSFPLKPFVLSFYLGKKQKL